MTWKPPHNPWMDLVIYAAIACIAVVGLHVIWWVAVFVSENPSVAGGLIVVAALYAAMNWLDREGR